MTVIEKDLVNRFVMRFSLFHLNFLNSVLEKNDHLTDQQLIEALRRIVSEAVMESRKMKNE